MNPPAATRQLVLFRLGEDLFGADIFTVERVLRYSEPRAIPNLPPWIEGVVDYRSRVVPVLDLRKRFELAARESTAAARVLILSIEGDLIGAIVDEVLEVARVSDAQLSAPPAMFRGLSAEFLLGLVKRGEGLVVVLDFARLFSTNERLVFEKLRDGENLV